LFIFHQNDHNATIEEGFTSIGQAFTISVDQFQAANSDPKKAGTCAKVVIRIEQELVLTRNAFLATLELFNEGTIILEIILFY
jgi:hypothetical protein